MLCARVTDCALSYHGLTGKATNPRIEFSIQGILTGSFHSLPSQGQISDKGIKLPPISSLISRNGRRWGWRTITKSGDISFVERRWQLYRKRWWRLPHGGLDKRRFTRMLHGLGHEAVRALCPDPVTHPLQYLIGSSIVTIYHVSDASYNYSFKFLTLPSYLPSCDHVLPKADQAGPSRPSASLPIAGLQLY